MITVTISAVIQVGRNAALPDTDGDIALAVALVALAELPIGLTYQERSAVISGIFDDDSLVAGQLSGGAKCK